MAKPTLQDVSGSVLIIPSVSIANIPQLASDLLLHTLSFDKFDRLSDKYLYPFVSPVDYTVEKGENASEGVSLPLEAYYSAQNHITLLQQRSPLIPGFAKAHVEEVLLPFINKGNFKHIVLLSLSDAGLVEHIVPGGISIYTNEDLLSDSLDTLRISESDVYPLAKSPGKLSQYEEALMDVLKTGNLTMFVSHVYEGDNFYDAQNLALKVAEVLKLPSGPWKTPVSWFGVYGDKPVPLAMEEGMYG